jgi:hypothetical protein
MDGVEFAVFCIARVEGNGNYARRVARVRDELREDIRKIDIGRQLLGLLVQKKQSATLIVHEYTGGRQRSV